MLFAGGVLPFCPGVGLHSLLQLTLIGLITAAQPPLRCWGWDGGTGAGGTGDSGGEKMQESSTGRIKDAVEAFHDCSM